jgi:hypothetical protein
MRADSEVPPTVAESLEREQSLEAQLLGAIAQNGVKGEPMRFCVFGLARCHCIGCIHYAAYLSVAVTKRRAEFQRRGPIGVILAREGLSYAGSCMRASENSYLQGT